MAEGTEGEIMDGAIPYYRIQEQVARREAQAGTLGPEHAERLQGVLCNLAHNVNNLLMRIQGCTSLMLLDVSEGQAGFERLKRIETHVEHGAVLTSQLLACAGRGVYNDPVNIPPLLLESRGGADAMLGESDIRSRLFIIAGPQGRLRPELLGTCRAITLKIIGIFAGMESVLLQGNLRWIETGYIVRVRQAISEGSRVARDVVSVFKPGRNRPVNRQLASLHKPARIYRVKPAARGGRSQKSAGQLRRRMAGSAAAR